MGPHNLPLSPAGPPQPFLTTTAEEIQGQFSPDAHWMAYTSNESGAPEVYVRKFPAAGGAWRISTRGGVRRGRRDGKELFYLAPDGKLMSVTVTASPAGVEAGAPRELFNTGITGSFLDRRNRTLSPATGDTLVNIDATRTGDPSPW